LQFSETIIRACDMHENGMIL